MVADLNKTFFEKYGTAPAKTYFAPGRVNLIGEHIDYNGGLVLPCAITMGTWLVLAPNNDQVIRFKSLNFKEEQTVKLQNHYEKEGSSWFNYPIGIFNEILKDQEIETGLDLLFFGNIPIGSGLSSSASIEVVMAYALNDHFNLGYDKLKLVLMSKSVENNFIGVNSGIMDQFAVTFGEKDKAILLNCDTYQYRTIECRLGDYQLAIINTNKARKLEESKYNERVTECQAAVKLLNQEITLHHLCELTADKFALHSHLITDPILLNRATHVIKENDRVNSASKALNEGNLEEFGRLMYSSHQSLKDLYEVSGAELDAVVDFCRDDEQVLGARMTGAGFGGCAIALLKKGHEDEFTEKLTAYYQAHIGYPPAVYLSEISNGASSI